MCLLLTVLLSTTPAPLGNFLVHNCTECHSEPEPSGDLDLEAIDATGDTVALVAWDRVRARLRAQDMPPRAEQRPAPTDYDAALVHVERLIDDLASRCNDPGAPATRRLNRNEWKAAVRDLLGVEIDVTERLPADEIGHGFDTVGDTLALTPMLLEKYVDAAEAAARAAIQDPDDPVLRTWAIKAGDLTVSGRGTLRRDEIWMSSRARATARVDLPRKGQYIVRFRCWGQQAGGEPVRLALHANDVWLATLDVPETTETAHETLVDLPGGLVEVSATFINDYYKPDDPDPAQRDRNAAVVGIEVAGPADEPVFSPYQAALPIPADEEEAAAILRAELTRLLPRAWRRSTPPATIADLARVAEGTAGTFHGQLRVALTAILVHPAFLHRLEQDPDDGYAERMLSGHEIAARMALFIWSSIPDEALWAAAKEGRLASREGRQAQVQRMLHDPRSRALSEHFATQWLQVRRLDTVRPDPRQFPSVDAQAIVAMQAETVDFFHDLMQEQRPWTDLLTAGGCGVLTHASVLTATSNPTRTSPVKRGKWILEALLDAPPPPPPPGVPALPGGGSNATPGSFREMLETHRRDPACNTCHERMDELGFALESFDAIGQPRDDVDDLGQFPGGVTLDGVVGVRDWILAQDAVPRSLARHMLTYAVGRNFDALDEAAIDGVAEHLKQHKHLASLVDAIVESRPFLYRGRPRGDQGLGR